MTAKKRAKTVTKGKAAAKFTALAPKQAAAVESMSSTTDDDVVAVPFGKYGCTAHKTHKPVPTASRIFRIFPARAQREVWGELRDTQRIALCGTGAVDANYAYEALEAGKPLPRGVGLTEAAIAREGIKRYKAAQASV